MAAGSYGHELLGRLFRADDTVWRVEVIASVRGTPIALLRSPDARMREVAVADLVQGVTYVPAAAGGARDAG